MRKTKVCLILAVFVLTTHWVAAKPEPEPRGRKRAFGAGLLGGVVAGGLIGKAMSQQSARPAAHAKHVTVIENSEPLANGCYKQTIKEPLPHNPHAYVETVHLICPTVTTAPPSAGGVPVTVAPPQLPWPHTNTSEAVPLMPQPAPFYPYLPAHGYAPNASQSNTSAPALPPMPVPMPMPVGTPQLQPTAVPAPVPAPVNPQVIVLSKKSVYYNKKKRSAACTLSVSLLLTALTLIAVRL